MNLASAAIIVPVVVVAVAPKNQWQHRDRMWFSPYPYVVTLSAGFAMAGPGSSLSIEKHASCCISEGRSRRLLTRTSLYCCRGSRSAGGFFTAAANSSSIPL